MKSIIPKQALLIVATVMAVSNPLLAQEAARPAPSVTIKGKADRDDATYKAGEKATFTFTVKSGNAPLEEGEIVCVVSKDGWKPQPPQTVAVKNGTATLISKLDEPGILLVRATLGKTTALAGAAYDPQLIQPSLPVPDDFDEFWAAQKTALAQVPVKSTLTPVKAPVEGIEAFDVQIEGLGKPVTGYFGRPKDAKPKSLPAILFVHGAGVRSSSLGNTNWAALEGGMLALDINAHGIPNGQPNSFYTDLMNGELKDYRAVGRDDRDKSYFKGMFLRMIRAIDFLTSQPEWDGKTVIVYGSSQGGYQAFAAAGIDDRVTLICAGVPAGCDHSGNVADRISGWPKLVPNNANGQPDEAVLQASRYVDCVNFAARAKCKEAAVTVGFIDLTCPATSVYAAYNALPMKKAIHTEPGGGHSNTPAGTKFMQETVRRHVREMHAK